MQDTAVTRTDNVLGVNETDICPEGSDSLDGFLNRGEDETGGNVSVRNTRDSHSNVVTAECHIHVFCLLREDTSDFNSVLNGFPR